MIGLISGLMYMFGLLTGVIMFIILGMDHSVISYKKLYCEHNITLETEEFLDWKNVQKIKVLKGEQKTICY